MWVLFTERFKIKIFLDFSKKKSHCKLKINVISKLNVIYINCSLFSYNIRNILFYL